MKTLRRALDALYDAAGVLAACFLVAMLVLIVLQMVARWTGFVFRGAPDYAGYCMAAASFLAFAHALNRGAHIRVTLLHQLLSPGAGPIEVGRVEPGEGPVGADGTDIGADIGADIGVRATVPRSVGPADTVPDGVRTDGGGRVGDRRVHFLDLWCLLAGAVATSLLAWYAVRAVLWSHRFHDVSQGQDATPLWIPQLGMAAGACLLALCFWDNFLSRAFRGRDNIVRERI